MRQRLRIGVSLGLRHAGESLWINGIKQNAIFLVEALAGCPSVEVACLVNMTDVDPDSVVWDRERWPVRRFEDVKDSLDVMIELGGQVGAEQTAYLKSRGTKLVSYCCGVEYVSVMQSILFDRRLWGDGLFINQQYDAIWVIPQVAPTSEDFFRVLRRCETTVVPFVWDPVFLEQRSADLAHRGAYRPRPGPARLSVIEPNLDVVKFCLYPILIVEELQRRRPDLIGFLHVTNARTLAEKNREFISMMSYMDIVRQHKASFVERFDTPQFLSDHTDAVVSHQWGNPLNYMYLEVCWQGYPLIHNAELCQDLGYFYAENDVRAGALALENALEQHDRDWEGYTARQRQHIQAYAPRNDAVLHRYDELLRRLTAA